MQPFNERVTPAPLNNRHIKFVARLPSTLVRGETGFKVCTHVYFLNRNSMQIYSRALIYLVSLHIRQPALF